RTAARGRAYSRGGSNRGGRRYPRRGSGRVYCGRRRPGHDGANGPLSRSVGVVQGAEGVRTSESAAEDGAGESEKRRVEAAVYANVTLNTSNAFFISGIVPIDT